MNIIKINNKVYNYESFWRPSKQKKILDFKNKPLPFPSEGDDWQNREAFINRLANTQEQLMRKGKFFESKRDGFKNCLLCKKKNITKGVFEIKKLRWEEGLIHYIKKHKVKPSDKFIEFIFQNQIKIGKKNLKIGKFLSRMKIDNNKRYLKLDRNQLLIFDALMEHGSYKKYVDSSKKNVFKYSEHAGLLDFNNTGLERIIIKGNTKMVSRGDDSILLPGEYTRDELDYEYIFHTHPPTEGIGGRAVGGVLYEFPSPGDIIHFINNYNEHKIQGSLVITPEGLYNIRKLKMDQKKLNIKKELFWRELTNVQMKIEDEAIKLYGTDIDSDFFYSEIAQNREYINKLNKFLNKYGLQINFYSRIKDNSGSWIIDTIYIPIFIIEPDYNIA
jgi:hypothetical protein